MSDLQRTDKWFADRLGNATGSRFNDIMAGSRLAGWKNYKAQLVTERLTGMREEIWTTKAMQWGTDNEPLAKLMYALATGRTGHDAPFVKHPELAAGVSPDWVLDDENAGVEFKCPNTATHLETLRTQKLPTHYKAQVMGQMWIMGWDWADFVSFDPRLPQNAQLAIVRVERDESYISHLETTIWTFLREVDADTEFVRTYGSTAAVEVTA